jgi:hypothetical protein
VCGAARLRHLEGEKMNMDVFEGKLVLSSNHSRDALRPMA